MSSASRLKNNRKTMLLGLPLLLLFLPAADSHTNGLASTPPMGWRSWNLYGPNVNQSLLEHTMDGMVNNKRHDHTGALVSLCDLGYCDVGLDDNWQACEAPEAVAAGMHYHDAEGRPLVNQKRFPDLKAMTDHAHALGLTAGWYHNNCICADHCAAGTDGDDAQCHDQIRADVTALLEYNFDSVKLDGCGDQMNLTVWDQYLTELSPDRPILVENCHGGYDTPLDGHYAAVSDSDDVCPFHFYRTSHDIRPSYASIMKNLGTMQQFYVKNMSYPGCWAYPDMLQVGVRRNHDDSTGLNPAETRSHFGAWAIVSSPLILSHDVNNAHITDEIWELISNREVLAVNQAYEGDSGGLFAASNTTILLMMDEEDSTEDGSMNNPKPVPVPAHQLLAKRLDKSRVAVLLMNSADTTANLVLSFQQLPRDIDDPHVATFNAESYQVRDVWNHKDLGVFTNDWSVAVPPHDAAFVLVEPVTLSTTESH